VSAPPAMCLPLCLAPAVLSGGYRLEVIRVDTERLIARVIEHQAGGHLTDNEFVGDTMSRCVLFASEASEDAVSATFPAASAKP